jgi:hypothetical protein
MEFRGAEEITKAIVHDPIKIEIGFCYKFRKLHVRFFHLFAIIYVYSKIKVESAHCHFVLTLILIISKEEFELR